LLLLTAGEQEFNSCSIGAPSEIREYDLNLSSIEDNVNGFSAFLSTSFICNDEMVDAVILHKQLLDVEDMRDKNQKLQVSLMECGTKYLVEEPSVPHFYHTHVDQMLAGIQNGEARRAIQTAHTYKVNAIMATPDRHMKKYVLNLPVGVKCKMGYMNPPNGRVLLGNMNISTQQIPSRKGVVINF
jgi:hypothetical protein